MRIIFKIILITSIFMCLAFSMNKDTITLAKKIENKTFSIKYFFVYSEDKNIFLVYLYPDKPNEFIVWNYTTAKKWQPVHNAKAYDGYKKADKTISGYKKEADFITFGKALTKDNNFVNKIANKKLQIKFYFWTSKTSVFLFYPKGDNNINIWHLTSNKKWMPIHNTKAYDGFSSAGNIFLDVIFNKKESTLQISHLSPTANICFDIGFCK
jgi:hypothetical protein